MCRKTRDIIRRGEVQKKKILSVLLAMMLVLSFAACSDSKDEGAIGKAQNSAGEAKQDKDVIGIEDGGDIEIGVDDIDVTGEDTCVECGKSVEAGEFFCDECMGYGTCQDCGKDIDDDSFYCAECLGI